MNLRMTYALEPDRAYVTCSLLKMNHELCQFSNTRHIVLDLSRLCGKYPDKVTKDLRINPSVQQLTFTTNEEFSEQDSDATDSDMPDFASDSDSEADTTVPA